MTLSPRYFRGGGEGGGTWRGGGRGGGWGDAVAVQR